MVQRTINFKHNCCNAQSFFNAPRQKRIDLAQQIEFGGLGVVSRLTVPRNLVAAARRLQSPASPGVRGIYLECTRVHFAAADEALRASSCGVLECDFCDPIL